MHDKTIIIQVLGFDASYIRDLTVDGMFLSLSIYLPTVVWIVCVFSYDIWELLTLQKLCLGLCFSLVSGNNDVISCLCFDFLNLFTINGSGTFCLWIRFSLITEKSSAAFLLPCVFYIKFTTTTTTITTNTTTSTITSCAQILCKN